MEVFRIFDLRVNGLLFYELSSLAYLNLKYIQVKLNELGQKEMDVMNYLLQSAPGLEILKLKLPEVYEEVQYNWFRQNLSQMKSALDNPCRMIIRLGYCLPQSLLYDH